MVEEWFNRNCYLTIRKIKNKIDEKDLLAIKNLGMNRWDCMHGEVQVNIRPVNYISSLTKEIASDIGVKILSNAKIRTEEQPMICSKEWVAKKILAKKK